MKNDIRVLIVDDDRIVRVAVRRILSKSDYNFLVEEATDSASLMAILDEKSFDCIILDYLLENTTGLVILEKLSNKKMSTPVIMMTGQGDEMLAVKAMKAGAYDYLPKSILRHHDSAEILSYTIRNAIGVYKSSLEKKRTAIALQKSEERYRSLVENSPISVLRFFPDNYMVSFVNDGLCNYFNKTRADLIGVNLFDYIEKDEHENILNTIKVLSKKKSVISLEYYSKDKDVIRWQLWTVQALFDKHGHILEYQCIGEDITCIKEAEKKIYNQKIYLQSIIDSQDNMIIVTDKKEALEANHSFLHFFSYNSLGEFKKENNDIISLALDIKGYISGRTKNHWIDSVLSDSKNQNLIAFQPASTKFPRVFSVTIRKLLIEGERYVVVFSDVTALEQKRKIFEKKASIDSLTGIFNRHKFNEMLTHNVDIARRYNTSLTLVFFDIDNFKNVNDTYGHQIGDRVIKDVVNVVRKHIRKPDVLARWGGEEFTLLLPQVNLNNALVAAEKLRKKIMKFDFNDVSNLTCSFGVSQLNENDTAEEFVKRADRAMYKAKESGRNKVVGLKAN